MLHAPNEFRKEAHTRLNRYSAAVEITDDCMKLNLGGKNPYQIDLNDVKSERDILNLLSRLSEKKGMDLIVVRVIIEKLLAHIKNV